MLLSIIVPVYNSELYIKKCLTSISKIQSADFECLIIDDGSEDNSKNICEEFVGNDGRFKLVSTNNKGVASARNLGIELSKGKYITFVDSDDIIYPISLSFLENKTIYSLNMFEQEGCEIKKIKFQNKNLDLNFVKYPTYMNSVCNKFFQKKIIDKYNLLFDINQYAAEDLLFVINFLVHANLNIEYVDKDYYIYRKNQESLTHKTLTQQIIRNYYNSYCKIYKIINDCHFENELKKTIVFQRLNSSILYLISVDNYNFNTFREITNRTDIWYYNKRIDFFLITLFAQMNLHFFCDFYIKIKQMLLSEIS